jgi:hypothetical protein
LSGILDIDISTLAPVTEDVRGMARATAIIKQVVIYQ